MDSRRNNDELNPAFRSLTPPDFEVVRLGYDQLQLSPLADSGLRSGTNSS